jgi:hypothetical protein
MKEQIFIRGTITFVLRNSKSKSEQMVYGIFTLSNKQYKISTGCKCLSRYWNKGNIKNNNSDSHNSAVNKLDAYNNTILIKKMYEMKQKFTEMVNYIYNNDISNIVCDVIVSKFFNYKPVKNNYRLADNKSISDTLLFSLNSYSKLRNIIKNSSTYMLYVYAIKSFEKFLNITNKNDIKYLDHNTVIEYVSYFQKPCKSSNKPLLKTSSINIFISKLKILISHLSLISDFDYNASKIANVKIYENVHKTNTVNSNYYMTFSKKEIMDIYSRRSSLKKQSYREILDLFILECESGCRISDTVKILSSEKIYDSINDIYTYKYQPSKGGKTAYPPCTEISEEICGRYKYGFSSVDIDNMSESGRNTVLKVLPRLFKQLGYSADIYNNIHTHTGRYSYITNKVDEGYKHNEIIYFTGHRNTAQIDKIYDRTSSFRKMQLMLLDHIRREKNNITPDNSLNGNIHNPENDDIYHD